MNIVRVVSPPALIEKSRSLQYANRESLDARFLSEKIKAETGRRKRLRTRQNPNSLDKAGGKLEFQGRQSYKLWKRRRNYLPPGYFLGPTGVYDDQGRLAVDTSDDKQKFTVSNPIVPLIPHPGPNPDALGPIDLNQTFLINEGRLTVAPRILNWGLPGSESGLEYRISSFFDYRTSIEDPVQFDSLDCTVEAFVYLPLAVVRQSSVVSLPSGPEYEYIYGIQVTSHDTGITFRAPHFAFDISCTAQTGTIESYFPSDARPGNTSSLYRGISGTGATWNLTIRSIVLPFFTTNPIPIGIGGQEVHIALTYSNNKISAYLAGQLIAEVPHYPTYAITNPMFSAGAFASSYITNFALYHNPVSGDFIQGGYVSRPYINVPYKLSRIRLTLDSIYSGQSFTPPSDIAGLY